MPSGSLGLTYGDENLYACRRLLRFPLGEGWFGSVGGFWRTSDGVRDPQFAADEGGQLTATLKHEGDTEQLWSCMRATSMTRTSSSRRFR